MDRRVFITVGTLAQGSRPSALMPSGMLRRRASTDQSSRWTSAAQPRGTPVPSARTQTTLARVTRLSVASLDV